mmetsp:Transcript_55556/g.180288  ORF Transcript_55556/g.180288 Transcript_55556/m.180288 type:complete len:175 (-) Transcript_55556:89-613(-)
MLVTEIGSPTLRSCAGMGMSHPMHPWGKKERIFAFVGACGFTLMPTALFRKQDLNDPGAIFIFITIPVMVFETGFYYLSVSHLCCRGGTCHCLTYCVRCCKLYMGCCTVMYLLIQLAVCYAILRGTDMEVAAWPFALSRFQSWVIWFPLWSLMPCLGFCHGWLIERKKLRQALL